MKSRGLGATLVLMAALAVWAPSARVFGQAVRATLLGTITDASGAVVPKAKVTATEVNTNIVREVQTNESGNYTFPDLAPGNYDVAVEQTGFKKAIRHGVDVLVDTTIRVDLRLETGAMVETVSVTAEVPLLQTDRSDTGRKIETRQVEELPIVYNNRNFQGLLNLVPGTSRGFRPHSPFFNAQDSLSTQVNGNSRLASSVQLEGVDDNERTGLLQVYIPPLESIQTVDVTTSNYEAELGRAGGAVTNVSLKSGANDFHGSAYAFYKGNGFNARQFFDRGPVVGVVQVPFDKLKAVYNYDGFNLGGPIKKNKIFFFGDLLRISDLRGVSARFTVPAADYRGGNFTAALGNFFCTDGSTSPTPCSGSKTPLMVNTTEGATVPARVGMVFDPNTGSANGSGRQVFSTGGVVNMIPSSRFDPIAVKVLNLVPSPNLGVATTQNPNLVASALFIRKIWTFDVKVDANPNEKNRYSARFSYSKPVTTGTPVFGLAGGPINIFNGGSGFEGTSTQKTYLPGFNWDHIFSPTLITETRFGITRYRNDAQQSDFGTKASDAIGIPGVNTSDFTSGLSSVELDGGISNPMVGYSASLPWIRAETNILLVNNWTKTHGNHTVKWGVDVRRIRDDLLQTQTINPRGRFTFGPNTTALNNGPSTSLGNSVASLLLGVPRDVGRDLPVAFPTSRITQFFAFGSDKWQVSPKLTLDLGLRWEFYPPATPQFPGGYSNYDPTTNNLVIAGIGGNPSNLGMVTRYKNFAPRLGIAYRLSDKTVVRSGFGISYEPFPDNTYAFNFPVKQNNEFDNRAGGSFSVALLPDGTPATFAKGFPAPLVATIPSSGIIPANTPLLISQGYDVINTQFKNPYVESWNLAVQRQLPHNFTFEVAYVGNHGVDIATVFNLNAVRDPAFVGKKSAGQPLVLAGFCQPGTTNCQTHDANMRFVGTSTNYNGLQVKFDHRSGNFLLTTAYTYSKTLGITDEDGGYAFYVNPQRSRFRAGFDRTHVFVQSYVYELPFGKGKSYLTSGWGNRLLGGWQVSGILTLMTGLPLNFDGCDNCPALDTPGNGQTGNVNGPVMKLYGIENQPWFDTSVFSKPAAGTFGNLGRRILAGPGYFSLDPVVFKRIRVTEKTQLEVRAEVYNATNTPIFDNPNTTVGNSNFGKVTGVNANAPGNRTMEIGAKLNF